MFKFHKDAAFKVDYCKKTKKLTMLEQSPSTDGRWQIVNMPEIEKVNIDLKKGRLGPKEAGKKFDDILVRLYAARKYSRSTSRPMSRNLYVVDKIFSYQASSMRLVGGGFYHADRGSLMAAAIDAGPYLFEKCDLMRLKIHLEEKHSRNNKLLKIRIDDVNFILNCLGRPPISTKRTKLQNNVLPFRRRGYVQNKKS